ncbi:tRNA N6-adenosine threonylcarbamoyltransferase, mitochondrial [Acrasis kona]|uniref:N(6)-L-threonylcarbamoyladenine synthase n=1 Tax=Acrasis kona TaxID=1008807 RepID=A0AAW2Z7C2_9EUKA
MLRNFTKQVQRTIAHSGWRGYTINNKIVLGIETSCDDTGIAIMDESGRIISETLITHSQLVADWGGVHPHEISKAHKKTLDGAIEETINKSNLQTSDIDAIAVTNGPGLMSCLRTGVEAAQQLSQRTNIPLISVHHLEAHLLIARGLSKESSNLQFPFLVLLASGGHCVIVEANGIGDYKFIGGTLDDSIGEAFDKIARLLNLDVSVNSGGHEIERIVKLHDGDPKQFKFPIPMMGPKRSEISFSFSGLKSSALWQVRKLENSTINNKELNLLVMNQKNKSQNPKLNLSTKVVADLAASFQSTAIAHLVDKTDIALKKCKQNRNIKDLVVCGGVAANMLLRDEMQTLCNKHNFNLHLPPIKYCTDNGVMVAWAGLEKLKSGLATSDVTLKPRWPLFEYTINTSQDA